MDETKVKEVYARLKIKMKNAYFMEQNTANLESFRVGASAYLDGPGQYENLSFFQICTNLEGKGIIGLDNLNVLEKLVENTPGGAQQLLKMINDAKKQIQGYMSAEVLPEPAGNFHRTDDTAVSHSLLQNIGKSNLHKSVGLISIRLDRTSSGTGFRVGKNFVMTAYHVFKSTIESDWETVINEAERSDNKEEIYEEIRRLFGVSPPDGIKPCHQRLPFGELFAYLQKKGRKVEDFEKSWKRNVSIAFGVRDGETTAGTFHFEYDIPFADKEHDVLVLQISENVKTLPPSLPLEERSVKSTVNLSGYPKGPTKVDLRTDIDCRVYKNNQNLQADVNEAIEWWKNQRNQDVTDQYADVQYNNDNGKVFLHTSVQFEDGSSGSPAIAMVNDQLVVQLMYLRGYPDFCYREKNFPPLKYLFEAGVSMPAVITLLQRSGLQILE
ncbi:uncharacterized protein LOC132550267 [Ylistrum balloti]|uniref:uncharacterized protein LOC132550267 n=1 Tax=Ylistrum balloti TaxID=509963 RepID=UPI002905A99E|nr:uncharacterized protein LOC132550267 [Ylistrum balloti]